MEQKVTSILVLVLLQVVIHDVEGIHYKRNIKESVRVDKFDHHKNYISKRQSETSTNQTFSDNHVYYMSQFYPAGADADELWFELAGLADAEVIVANISDSFRFYMLHNLPFEFQFYGHTIDRVGITTGGFLYAGTVFHEFVHLTQFIAPLQADFNPGLNDTARILVYQDDNRFTVQWDRVHNHDHQDNGTFTFQVTLFRDGRIHFVYREIPLPISEIDNDDHPVEVGLSDAFYVRRRLPGNFPVIDIYEYHRVQLSATDMLANTAYVITPVPNCIQASSCSECVALADTSEFSCEWCDTLSRCSDGVDRHRQEWFTSSCSTTSVTECKPLTTTYTTSAPTPVTTYTTSAPTPVITLSSPTISSPLLATSSIIGIVVFIVLLLIVVFLVVACVGVLVYGYKNPTSRVGLFMIEHRPKARSLNKTSASYNIETGKTALSED